MARYICPSCGKRYNGKRCGNCMYENFTEEYTHGNHTHTGEPLVIREPQRRPIPRKDPFDCEKKTRKPGLRPWVLVIILLSVIVPVAKAVIGIVLEITSEVSDSFVSISSRKADAVMPSGGITLYDDGQLRIVADWEETRKYSDGIRVIAENNTNRNLNVVARDILVNNYVMEYSSLYCPVEAGHTAEGYLYLDNTDLEAAEIEDVQQVSAIFEAYDSETYETQIQTGYITLCSTDSLSQPLADRGVELYNKDGIRLICKGYAPTSYAPDEYTEGDILFYLENGTDATVDFYTDDVTVNGQETYLSLFCSLPPHTQAVQRMFLFGLDSEELSIQSREDVKEMLAAFGFRIVNDSGEGTTLTTDPLSIPVDLDWSK